MGNTPPSKLGAFGAFATGSAGIFGGLRSLFDNGTELKIDNSISTRLTIEALAETSTTCNTTVNVSNTFTTNSSPRGTDASNSSGCLECLSVVQEAVAERSRLETEASERNRRYQNQTLTTSLIPLSNEVCDFVCKDIVSKNVDQDINWVSSTGCQVNSQTRNDLQQTIQGKLQQYLESKTDVFGELSSIFNRIEAGVSNSMATTMTDSIQESIREVFITSANVANTITVNGNSIYLNGLSQQVDGSVVAKLQSQNNLLNQIRQSATYGISQSLVYHNDTIGDVATSLSRILVTMGKILEDTIGAIIVAVGAVLLAVLLTFSSMYLFNKTFRSYVDQRLGSSSSSSSSSASEFKKKDILETQK